MSVLERRLEDVKRGYVLGDFSVEEFEAEVEAILAAPAVRRGPRFRSREGYLAVQIELLERR